MRGQGDVGEYSGHAGDLYVRVHVEPDRVFTRNGNDVLIRAELNVVSAMLGGIITVPTLEGDKEIRIQPGVQTGHHEVIRGLGVPAFAKRRTTRRPDRSNCRHHTAILDAKAKETRPRTRGNHARGRRKRLGPDHRPERDLIRHSR